LSLLKSNELIQGLCIAAIPCSTLFSLKSKVIALALVRIIFVLPINMDPMPELLPRKLDTSKRILFGVTDSVTLKFLMKGQLEWLAGRGYEIFTASNGDFESPLLKNLQTQHIRIDMTRSRKFFSELHAFKEWASAFKTVRPDIVVLSTPKASLFGLITACALRVPKRVYLVRGLRYETEKGLFKTVLKFCEWACLVSATNIITVSMSVEREVKKFPLIRSSKIETFGLGSSNGVDSTRFQPAGNQEKKNAKRALGLDADDIVVGYVGRISFDKGVECLNELSEMKGLSENRIQVIAIGSFDDKVVLSPMVKHFDSVDEPELLFPAIDILILPTRREGFPNVVLEAASCGIPAVVTDATGARDAVCDSITGFIVARGDVSSMYFHIRELARNPRLRCEMGEAARVWVVKNFQPERLWIAYDEVFKRP